MDKLEIIQNLKQFTINISDKIKNLPLKTSGYIRQEISGIQTCLSILEKNNQSWISVKDRLPAKKGTYLFYNGENMFCKVYDKTWFTIGRITHWMPLPEPPEV